MFCGLRKNANGRPIGTPNACLKRGIGIGMMIEQQKATNLGAIPQQENNPIGINQQMPAFNIIDDNDMRDRFDLLGNFDIANPVGYNLQPVPVAPDLRNQMRDAELSRVTNELANIKPEPTKGVKNLRSKISNLKKKKEAKSLKKELEKIETAMELKQLLEESEEAVDNPLQVQRGITDKFKEENEQLKKAFRIAKKNNQPFNLRFDIDNMLEQIAVYKKRFPKAKKELQRLQKMKSVIKQEEAKRDKYQPK